MAGLAFVRLYPAGSSRLDGGPGARQRLLRFDRSGVHLDLAILRGLPHQDGWIDGAVAVTGRWPEARLGISQIHLAPPLSQAVYDTSAWDYQWSDGGWRIAPPDDQPAYDEKSYPDVVKACTDLQRYNILVRVERLELPTGQVFIVGNCQWRGSKAPSRPPSAVAAMWDPERSSLRAWRLPETSDLDVYMQAHVHGLFPSQMYVTIAAESDTPQPYLASLSQFQATRIPVPFAGRITSLAPLMDGSLWMTLSGRLVTRTRDGAWHEVSPDESYPNAEVTEVGSLDGVRLWMTTRSADGTHRLLVSDAVDQVYR